MNDEQSVELRNAIDNDKMARHCKGCKFVHTDGEKQNWCTDDMGKADKCNYLDNEAEANASLTPQQEVL